MRAFFKDLGSVLAGVAVPFRSFLRWNAAKLLIGLYSLGLALVLALPGLVAAVLALWGVAERVSFNDVMALQSPDTAVEAFKNLWAVAGWRLLGGFLALGWCLAAGLFSFGYAFQVLLQGATLRAAGEPAFPVTDNLWWSGLALRKFLAASAWAALLSLGVLVAFVVVDLVAGALVAALGGEDSLAVVTAYGVARELWFGSMFFLLGVKFGFAPLALVADLRPERTGWSYVLESWKMTAGRSLWRTAGIWLGCVAAYQVAFAVLQAAGAAGGGLIQLLVMAVFLTCLIGTKEAALAALWRWRRARA